MSTPGSAPHLPSTSRLRHEFVAGWAFSSAPRNDKPRSGRPRAPPRPALHEHAADERVRRAHERRMRRRRTLTRRSTSRRRPSGPRHSGPGRTGASSIVHRSAWRPRAPPPAPTHGGPCGLPRPSSRAPLSDPVGDGPAGEPMELRDHVASGVHGPEGGLGVQTLRDRWWWARRPPVQPFSLAS